MLDNFKKITMNRYISLSGIPVIAALMLACAFCTPAAGPQPLFWESEFASALDTRDSFYRSAGIDSASFASMQRENHGVTLKTTFQDTSSLWYYFLKGLSSVKDSSSAASLWFSKALAATEKDPGQTLALALEFGRCNQAVWQEKSLKKLSTQFLMSGAQSAPLVSQIMLFNAVHSPAGGDRAVQSQSARSWAAAFDRHCIWPMVLSIKEQGVLDFSKSTSFVHEIVGKISSSWELQLWLTRQLYLLLFHICLFLVAGTFAGIAVKYLPMALHSASELLTDAYRLKVKFVLALVIYLSFLFVGILPFLWISFFLLWRHLRRMRDKTLMGIVLALVVLFPLHVRFMDMLESCCSPKGPVMLMHKAIDEGYYPALDSSIASLLKKDRSDFLAHTAAAIVNLKKGDAAAAAPHVRSAQQLFPSDPVVIVTAGNTLYFAGDLAGARAAYQECIKLHPGFEPAYFNLGQYYFNSMETAKGMEYITKAAKINPAGINAFIKANDESFSKDWPLGRQLIQPDYSPSYFWKTIFPRYGGSWKEANEWFGADFMGISLPVYGCGSVVLLFILMLLDTLVWSKDTVRKIYTCKLCQTPICRKCKRGGVCQDCFNSTQHIRNENIRQRIMSKIQFRSRRYHIVIATVLDIVFPGSGLLYASAPLFLTLPILVLTSAVYGLYLAILAPSLVYPAWLLRSATIPVLCGCLLYNAVFIGRALVKFVKELKPQGE
jgi:tetratricopeptide (TPR) repeat protein